MLRTQAPATMPKRAGIRSASASRLRASCQESHTTALFMTIEKIIVSTMTVRGS
jgi:hypothetical protein